jgi:hypothetical protein
MRALGSHYEAANINFFTNLIHHGGSLQHCAVTVMCSLSDVGMMPFFNAALQLVSSGVSNAGPRIFDLLLMYLRVCNMTLLLQVLATGHGGGFNGVM